MYAVWFCIIRCYGRVYSLLALDLIEHFLAQVDEETQKFIADKHQERIQ